MNADDLHVLWLPAVQGLYGEVTLGNTHKLELELRTKCFRDYFERATTDDWPMASDPTEATLIPILKALAGPHGKTLLKVWKIQKGRAA